LPLSLGSFCICTEGSSNESSRTSRLATSPRTPRCAGAAWGVARGSSAGLRAAARLVGIGSKSAASSSQVASASCSRRAGTVSESSGVAATITFGAAKHAGKGGGPRRGRAVGGGTRDGRAVRLVSAALGALGGAGVSAGIPSCVRAPERRSLARLPCAAVTGRQRCTEIGTVSSVCGAGPAVVEGADCAAKSFRPPGSVIMRPHRTGRPAVAASLGPPTISAHSQGKLPLSVGSVIARVPLLVPCRARSSTSGPPRATSAAGREAGASGPPAPSHCACSRASSSGVAGLAAESSAPVRGAGCGIPGAAAAAAAGATAAAAVWDEAGSDR